MVADDLRLPFVSEGKPFADVASASADWIESRYAWRANFIRHIAVKNLKYLGTGRIIF